MGTLVADASALTEYLAGGSGPQPYARHIKGADLHVPEVCDAEVVSAFRRSVLNGDLSATAMRLLLADYAELPLRRHRHLGFVGRAFELRNNFSAADAMYVALAERLGADLLTADRRLARAVGTHTAVHCLP